MIPVQIVALQIDAETGAAVVVLAESSSPTRVLPIIIGAHEAQAIAFAVAGFTTSRPLTHDLMVTLIEQTGSRLEEVAITELVDGTFLAELTVEAPAGPQRVSSRPSDGIALAVRVGASIVVAADVLDLASVPVQRDTDEPFSDDEIDAIVEEFHRTLATADVSDFETEIFGSPDDDDESDVDKEEEN